MRKNKMTRRNFLRATTAVTGVFAIARGFSEPLYHQKKKAMRFRLIRHATILLSAGPYSFLVDPMLSIKEAMDPVGNAANKYRIPMTDLPINETELKEMLSAVDAVLVTHTHRDHWDTAAQQMIAKDKKIFCQPVDEEKIRKQGFTNVTAISEHITWEDVQLFRTGGQHGTGEIGKQMGIVSGFVVKYKDASVYIAGDTVWCSEVENAIQKYSPGHIIVNGGGARFLTGDPITMTIDDVAKVADYTEAPLSVVHLDTVNHCLQKRSDFRAFVTEKRLSKKIQVPEDGEWIAV